jgi:hypothetical protein
MTYTMHPPNVLRVPWYRIYSTSLRPCTCYAFHGTDRWSRFLASCLLFTVVRAACHDEVRVISPTGSAVRRAAEEFSSCTHFFGSSWHVCTRLLAGKVSTSLTHAICELQIFGIVWNKALRSLGARTVRQLYFK